MKVFKSNHKIHNNFEMCDSTYASHELMKIIRKSDDLKKYLYRKYKITTKSKKVYGGLACVFIFKNHIVKIYSEAYDSATKHFYDFVCENADNKYLPKIYSEEKIEVVGTLDIKITLNIVKMERLYTLGSHEYDLLCSLFDTYMNKHDINMNYVKLSDEIMNMFNFIYKLKKLMDKKGLTYDLYGKNILKRKNGEPVITDPFV